MLAVPLPWASADDVRAPDTHALTLSLLVAHAWVNGQLQDICLMPCNKNVVLFDAGRFAINFGAIILVRPVVSRGRQ